VLAQIAEQLNARVALDDQAKQLEAGTPAAEQTVDVQPEHER
jgi:hypothetical protein